MTDSPKYNHSSHSKYDLRVHIVWVTKYRYKVIDKELGARIIDIIKTISKNNNIKIISGILSSDHVHIYLSIRPDITVSKIAQLFKGITSNKIMQEYPNFNKKYWGRHFWARGYFCSSVGQLDSKTIQEYIDNHNDTDTDDDTFRLDHSIL